MNDGRETVWIGEREALPVRAIPYVTSWQVSPDSIVRALAEPSTIKVGTNLEIHNKHSLVAYLMGDHGHYEPLPASQWKDCAVALNSLTQKLKADERKDATDENYGPWRVAAILKLPDNVFVWLDEFQPWYSATRPMIHRGGDATRLGALLAARECPDLDARHLDGLEAELFQTGGDSLCLTPILPPEIEGKVWRYAEVALPVATEAEQINVQPSSDALLKDVDGTETRNQSNRITELRAFLIACNKEGVALNIESIWLHIRQHVGKENFLFASASESTATTIDGKKVQKKNLGRTLRGLLTIQKKQTIDT